MKTLLLLRHAKSDWAEPDLSDHDRPLNGRGKRDAPRMGQLLRAEGLTPDWIAASSAKRARKTARLVAEACGYEGEIQVEEVLYLAGPEAYLEVLSAAPESAECALLVGHNPGLEELLEALTGEAEGLPTAALVRVTLPVARWAEVDENTEGELVRVWRPREVGERA